MAEVSSRKDWDPKTRFACRNWNWSEASHLLNSVLGLRPHLASPLFNCDHHFSALRSSSLLRPSFQQFPISPSLHTSAQLFFTSSPLFSTLLNDSHPCPPLFNCSQLVSTLLTSAQFILPLSQLISTFFVPCQLFSTLANSHHLFTEMRYTVNLLHTEAFCTPKLLHREVFTHIFYIFLHTTSFYTETFTHTMFLHRETFTQSICYLNFSLMQKRLQIHFLICASCTSKSTQSNNCIYAIGAGIQTE